MKPEEVKNRIREKLNSHTKRQLVEMLTDITYVLSGFSGIDAQVIHSIGGCSDYQPIKK